MATIDLTDLPDAPSAGLHLLDPLPRRLALTLPELQWLAKAAGGAPLPFDVTQPGPSSSLDSRLGPSRASADDAAYLAARASLHDPAETLLRRGLVDETGAADPTLLGAIGLLATPRVALEIDVAVGSTQVKAWHRSTPDAVATLSTVDGLVFEIAWFAPEKWSGELARVAALPEDFRAGDSVVPPVMTCPFELVDAVGEALAQSRTDLVQVLVAQHPGTVRVDGVPLGSVAATRALRCLHTEAVGRLRVLAATVEDDPAHGREVGVLSWVLLADGWHALEADPDTTDPDVRVRRVDPAELAADLAPVLAGVGA